MFDNHKGYLTGLTHYSHDTVLLNNIYSICPLATVFFSPVRNADMSEETVRPLSCDGSRRNGQNSKQPVILSYSDHF